jgi:hypothetical protein
MLEDQKEEEEGSKERDGSQNPENLLLGVLVLKFPEESGTLCGGG